MKNVLASIFLILSNLSFGQSYTIDTIVEKSPYFPGDIYRFPIIYGRDDRVCKRINTHLVKYFLDVEYGCQKTSVFENVWGEEDEPYATVNELKFGYNLSHGKVYTVKFSGFWCGAYCENFNKSYNYNLKTGNFIELDTLINVKSKKIVLQYLSMLKREKILKQISILDKNLMSDSMDKDTRNYNEEAKFMFHDCLSYSEYESFLYFDFSITNDFVTLTSGRCSNHIDQALDGIRNFIFTFKLKDIKNHLSPYGIELLL